MKRNTKQQKFLSIDEFAQLFNKPKSSIRKLVRNKQLTAVQLGKMYYIDIGILEEIKVSKKRKK